MKAIRTACPFSASSQQNTKRQNDASSTGAGDDAEGGGPCFGSAKSPRALLPDRETTLDSEREGGHGNGGSGSGCDEGGGLPEDRIAGVCEASGFLGFRKRSGLLRRSRAGRSVDSGLRRYWSTRAQGSTPAPDQDWDREPEPPRTVRPDGVLADAGEILVPAIVASRRVISFCSFCKQAVIRHIIASQGHSPHPTA